MKIRSWLSALTGGSEPCRFVAAALGSLGLWKPLLGEGLRGSPPDRASVPRSVPGPVPVPATSRRQRAPALHSTAGAAPAARAPFRARAAPRAQSG